MAEVGLTGAERLYISQGGNGASSVSVNDVAEFASSKGGGDITSSQIKDATTVGKAVLTAADAATARTAIGAGTSNLAIGTTATTAKAGDYAPAAATAAAAGVVKLGAAVANATDSTDTTTQLNALLASLRAAGVIAAS